MPTPEPMPGEPSFTLLARDTDFAGVIAMWAMRRLTRVAQGLDPITDIEKVRVALELSRAGTAWRAQHVGEWRTVADGDV